LAAEQRPAATAGDHSTARKALKGQPVFEISMVVFALFIVRSSVKMPAF
jgi:hypothetical protein